MQNRRLYRRRRILKEKIAVRYTIPFIIVILFLVPVSALGEESAELRIEDVESRYMERGMIDGVAWQQFTDDEKGFYLLGFEDGVMGITIHFIGDEERKKQALSVLPMSVEGSPPLSAVVKEIDDFYGDKDNRDIQIYYVLQIIRNRLLGIDEKKIRRYILYLREGANANLEEALEEGQPKKKE